MSRKPNEAEAAEELNTQTEGGFETGEEQAPSELELLQAELESMKDQHLRTLAEYQNFRTRTQKEREAIYPEAKAAVLTDLLPMLDNFARALEAGSSDQEFLKGVEMIFHSFEVFLSKQGVEPLGEVGELFDPQKHNAVMHIEDDSQAEGTICEVFQKGYKMGDRVLRYAMVKVAN